MMEKPVRLIPHGLSVWFGVKGNGFGFQPNACFWGISFRMVLIGVLLVKDEKAN